MQLFQSVEWSRICWDESWSDKISISDILPKEGSHYEIKLLKNEDYAKEGQASFLWRPPHSELNGWDDKRPSEILNSYILTGVLSDSQRENLRLLQIY